MIALADEMVKTVEGPPPAKGEFFSTSLVVNIYKPPNFKLWVNPTSFNVIT